MAKKSTTTFEAVREAAEDNLETFIKLVAPHRVVGGIHQEIIGWWNRSEAKAHQLLLLPRGHQKSALMAYRVAWEITRNPAVTILYISSTSGLAERQLKAIKDVLTSPIYTRYWPEMVNEQEGKRETWTASTIAVDHPKRKLEGVRDPTVFTGGLTTSLTGFHCDIAVLDDVVVQENAYTEEGRTKVKTQYSLLSSIENPDAREWVVGTRYHPKDLYASLMEMQQEIYDAKGELAGTSSVYEVFERKVEDVGDGSGEYIWPRQRRPDGKWFGFDQQVLATKRAQYLDKTQFRAQYYNDPNDPDNQLIGSDRFQYFERGHLTRDAGLWYYKSRKLNVFAAIDFAYSLRKKADYTALVVIGMDSDSNIYVLDIIRFKTDRISDYYDQILKAHVKWGFRKIRAEVTAAQRTIVRELKDNYIRTNGLALTIDEHNPNRHQGTKEERMALVLEPRYTNMSIWHYQGGNCQVLEEELVLAHPPHDDVKDALTCAIEMAVPPTGASQRRKTVSNGNIVTHSRFGGVKFN